MDADAGALTGAFEAFAAATARLEHEYALLRTSPVVPAPPEAEPRHPRAADTSLLAPRA